MPSIVTAAQLRSILGVSSSLYNDAYLEGIIDTSEAVILPMLVANSNAVNAYKLKDNVAVYYTQREHYFVAGQSIVVTGLPSPFSATVTVVEAALNYFTAAITNADVTLRASVPSGTATLSGYSAAEIYANNQAIEFSCRFLTWRQSFNELDSRHSREPSQRIQFTRSEHIFERSRIANSASDRLRAEFTLSRAVANKWIDS
jgi:hypothetical protein